MILIFISYFACLWCGMKLHINLNLEARRPGTQGEQSVAIEINKCKEFKRKIKLYQLKIGRQRKRSQLECL